MSEQNCTGNSLTKKFSILKFLKYIVISYAVSFILVLSLAALVVYTDVPERAGTIGVEVTTFVGSFICGLLMGRNKKSCGLLCGGIIGAVSIAGLLLLGLAVYGETADMGNALVKISGGFLSGAFGGVLGVNTGKE